MKHLVTLSLLALSLTATAGGLVTNSNQSASFLRNPARDAVIDIDGVYTNPAGISFLRPGFHLGLTIQHPEQQRNVTTCFQPLAGNVNHLGQACRTFKGQASAPAVPSFQAAYVWKHWTAQASFAFTGGGGKCEFDDGIGSIESMFATLPLVANQTFQQMGLPYRVQGYSLDSYMKGRQYYYGIQLGTSYRLNDHLAFAFGLRALVGSAEYTGYVHDLKLYADAATKTELPEALAAPVYQQLDPTGGRGRVDMTTDQTCVGFTPVLGIDWRIDSHWNLSAKYEFRTKMNLKNKTKEMNAFARAQAALDQFNDQKNRHVRDDMPGTLALGLQYSPIAKLRFNAGFHWYDDKNAVKFADEHKNIKHGTREELLGAEWDIIPFVTASIGWQNTLYSLKDAYYKDMSYNCSSNLLGLGVRLHPSKKVSIDLGFMHNFYRQKTVNTQMAPGLTKSDTYKRKNDVVAVGVNLDF